MARTLRSDKLLFWSTLLLVGCSVVMVYSASAVQALDRSEAPWYYLIKQFSWAVIGFGLLLVVMRVDYHELRRPALIWTLLGVTLALLVAVFFFEARNGTHRWISIGPITLQPSELAKLAVIIFAAALLERRMHRVDDVGYALAPVAVVGTVLGVLVVLEPDFGTAVMLFAVVTAIAFGAGLSYRYFFGTMLAMLPVAAGLIVAEPYRYRRLMAFLDPEADPLGAGYQLNQSLIAVGSGGGVGRGLMEGVQKQSFLPEPHTDFIYAVVGEEFGLIGTTLILVCFLVIAWRGLRAGLLAPDRFGSLLAIGLTMMVVLQALLNMSVVLGLLPTKGIPLPFVSNGGSSLLVSMVAMGILLNISQQSQVTAARAIEV